MDQKGFDSVFALIFQEMFESRKLLSEQDLTEGVHVSLANFSDTLIDYPNSKGYAFRMFAKLRELGVVSEELEAKYRRHVEKLENDDYE